MNFQIKITLCILLCYSIMIYIPNVRNFPQYKWMKPCLTYYKPVETRQPPKIQFLFCKWHFSITIVLKHNIITKNWNMLLYYIKCDWNDFFILRWLLEMNKKPGRMKMILSKTQSHAHWKICQWIKTIKKRIPFSKTDAKMSISQS